MTFIDSLLHKLAERSIQLIKREPGYHVDPALTGRVLLSILSIRFWCMIRSLRWIVGLRQRKGFFFVGRRVTIRHPQYLSVGRGVTFGDDVFIDALSREGISIGDNVSIGSFTIIKATGILGQLGKGFRIGDNSNIADYTFVGAAGGVTIGNQVLMGQRVSFHSENHNYARTDIPIKAQGVTQQGIVIEDNCWIGAGSIFVDGVTVHQGTIVAAGSVVTKDFPPYSVVGGVPARIIRSRLAAEGSMKEEV